jgi:hypothetical protein
MPTWAGSVAGHFQVKIRLQSHASGLCISQTLSEQTNATVTVTCRDKEFVSIEARPGIGMQFAHGGAYRYVFMKYDALASLRSEDSTFGMSSGTITGLRVLRIQDSSDRLELLVSF